MQNYVNYFTEIEEHFQRRRGSLLLLSTLDWALIETWREAGIPLAAVLNGIDAAFDKYEARQSKRPQRRINGLAWASQAVLEAAEQQREAATGSAPATDPASGETSSSGFEPHLIAAHLNQAAQSLCAATIAPELCAAIANSIRDLAQSLEAQPAGTTSAKALEELERHLTVLEEKLFATLTTHAPEDVLLTIKTDAAQQLAAYRSRMSAVQIRQIEQQFLQKRLLEHYSLPRLSLFYMRQAL